MQQQRVLHLITDNFYLNDFAATVAGDGRQHDYVVLCLKKRPVRFLKFPHRVISFFDADFRLLKESLGSYQRVIIHFATPAAARLLAGAGAATPRIIWIFWGGEFYFLPRFFREIYFPFARQNKARFREQVVNLGRRLLGMPAYTDVESLFASGRIDYCATYIPGDFANFQKAFPENRRTRYTEFAYQDFFPAPFDAHRAPGKELLIQVGNSADPGNNHYEALELLWHHKREVRIFCPLSYGDARYAQKIAERGRALFGDQFQAQTTFLEKEAYFKMLDAVDVALFNNPYQQGAGNAIQLAGCGKTLYLHRNNALYDFFREIGVQVFDVADIAATQTIRLLSPQEKLDNQQRIAAYFSPERKKQRFENLFNV